MAVRHAFTVDEWHRMGEAGLFGDNARLELLDGEVIEMSPIGSPHAACVARLARILLTAVGERAVLYPQNPVQLDDRSEPQPDIALLAPRADGYSRAHALPPEILLLIEVSDATLAFDRDRKAPYYAKTGVVETWVVDLGGDRILVMRSPTPDGYLDVRTVGRDGQLDIEALPAISVSADDILGPNWPVVGASGPASG